ncbi:MAG: LysE family transporter [Cytophagales bacterium]|nr:LysE family transporter [Cytophagales bacterium]
MIVQVFLVSFIISYLGSIPPGVANVSVVQMAVQNHKRAAIFFSLSASLVEFLYAGLTVKFQIFLKSSTRLEDYFQIVTAAALVGVGILSLLSKAKSADVHGEEIAKGRAGFKRGIVLGFLNPMTIPFWLMVTAYIQNHDVIPLEGFAYWLYLIGISSGTFSLLMTVLWLGNKFTRISDNQLLVHKVPGFLLIGLGIYTLVKWLI